MTVRVLGFGVLVAAAFALGYAIRFETPAPERHGRAERDRHRSPASSAPDIAAITREPQTPITPEPAGEDAEAKDAVDLFSVEPGGLFDVDDLQPGQRDEIRKHMTLQGAVSGFDMDRALMVRGDDRDLAAVILRDTVTRRQLDLADFDSDFLAELVEAHADIQYYRNDAYQRAVDGTPYTYATKEQALAAKERDAHLARFSLRRLGDRLVLVDLRPTRRDPDVERCRGAVHEIDAQLGVRSQVSWYCMTAENGGD